MSIAVNALNQRSALTATRVNNSGVKDAGKSTTSGCWFLIWGVTALLALGGCQSTAEQSDVPVDGRDWYSFGGSDDGEHYSPLTQITDANIFKLGLAWAYEPDPKLN